MVVLKKRFCNFLILNMMSCLDEGKFPFLISCNLIGRERSRDLGLFTQLSLCKQKDMVHSGLKNDVITKNL